MKEININVTPTLGVIEFNNEELKEALALQMTAYENLEITEQNIPESKADLAVLRKIREAVETERKRIKKEFTKPLDDFEGKCKELTQIIDKPIKMINDKLTGFEEKRKEEKRKHLKELYESNIKEYGEFLPYDKIYNPKWENKTSTDKDVISDISEAITVVRSDLDSIKAMESEIEDKCIEAYRAAGNDIKAAIKKNSDYLAAKQMAEQRVREEAERKAREEAERQAQVEAERKEEVKEVPIVETVTEDLKVANEEVVSFVVSGKENVEKVRLLLNLEDIPYEEV